MWGLPVYRRGVLSAYNACRSSGRTVKDWCKESGISEQTYYRWQKRLFEMARQQQEERFAEITPERVEHWDEIKTDSPPIWVLHLCFYLQIFSKIRKGLCRQVGASPLSLKLVLRTQPQSGYWTFTMGSL